MKKLIFLFVVFLLGCAQIIKVPENAQIVMVLTDTLCGDTTITDTVFVTKVDTIFIHEVDTIVITEIDTIFIHDTVTENFESTSQIIDYYHNQMGKFIDTHDGLDSVFYKQKLVTVSGPGYNADNLGTFYDTNLTIIGLTDEQLISLGYKKPFRIELNAGVDDTTWLVQTRGSAVMWSTNYYTPPLDSMYISERWGNFSYHIPLDPGDYSIELHFCEDYYNTVGSRIFNVRIEGVQVLTDFDILDEGEPDAPLIRTFNRTISNGYLDIEFITVKDASKLSGLVIKRFEG